jgi:hypothetical protein
MPQSELPSRLHRFNSTLTDAEQANFKLLLGLAAGGLAPGFGRPLESDRRTAFDAVSHTLAGLQPHADRVRGDGIAFRGRPRLMSDELLRALQAEARTLRPEAMRYDEHYLGCGAPVANELSTSRGMHEFVQQYAGPVRPTGVASFLYYDEPGQGIAPHIDTDIFSLNVLIMLDHQRPPSGAGSALIAYPAYKEPERLELEAGEIVVMFAGSVAHGRERIVEGESVSILTLGFQPVVSG